MPPPRAARAGKAALSAPRGPPPAPEGVRAGARPLPPRCGSAGAVRAGNAVTIPPPRPEADPSILRAPPAGGGRAGVV